MAERSVVVRLRANVADFDKQMAVARRAAEELAKKSKQSGDEATTSLGRLAASARDNEQAWTQVGTTFTAVGAAAAAGIGAAVVQYARFDAAMSKVQAATHETAGNMEQLREAAIRAGADTAFSAEEAAGAIEELAKAGVSTEQILSGGLDGALALAAAGNIDVAEAAEVAASAMTQFGLEGSKVPHIADLLAAGAGKAQGSVSDLGQALNQSGLVAAQTGLSIEETTGGLAAFASAGLIGSDAGTSFKTMLQSLTPSSNEAKQAMDDIGFSAYDADGNFVGLTEVARQLQTGLADLSVEQQNATLKTIFGSDAVRAAAVIFQEGATGVQSWIDQVNDAGYAAETAAINLDNLQGDIEGLRGSLETALIGTGESANGPLRDLVQGLDGVVDAYNRLGDGAQGAVLTTGGVVAATGLAAGAFFTLAPRVFETIDSFRQLNAQGGPLSGRMRGVAGAVGAATGALVAFQVASSIAGSGSDDLGRVAEVVEAINDLDGNGAARLDELANAAGSGTTSVRGLADAVETVQLGKFAKTADFIGSGFGVFDSEVGLATDALTRYDEALTLLVSNGALDQAAAGADHLRAMVEAGGGDFDAFANEYLPGYTDSLSGLDLQQQLAAESGVALADAAGQLQGPVAAGAEALNAVYASAAAYAEGMGLSEEATQELNDRITELGETMLAFTDPSTVYQELLTAKTEQERATAEATAAATSDQADSWEDYVGDVKVSLDEYIVGLQEQQAAQEEWKTNLLIIASRTTAGFAQELAKMGPDAAELVAQAADGSDEQLRTMVGLFEQRGSEAVTAWGEGIEYGADPLAQIAAKAGQGAANAAAEELAKGTKTIEQIAADYGIALAGGVNPVLKAIGKPTIRSQQIAAGRGLQEADGGVVDFYAAGGLREDHVAQIAPAGAWRVWAEDETGGEAYIPLHPSKRARSLSIWEETGRRLGAKGHDHSHDDDPDHSYEAYVDGGIRAAQRFANGGFTSTSSVPKVPSPGGGFPLSTAAQAVMEKARADVVEWLKGNLALAYPPATAGGNPYLGGGGNSTIVQIGRFLQSKGARISGHPAWGRVGRHSPTSLHYKSRAIDVNYGGGGANAAENRFVRGILPTLRAMANFSQVYYREIGGRTDHDDHLHLGIANGAVLDQGPKGTVFNPHVRDRGGPLHQGFTLNATGAAEDVVPRHVVDPPRQYAPAGAGQGGGITQQFVVDARGRDGNDVARRIGNRVHDEMVMLRL